MNMLEAMRIYVRVVERGIISHAARDLNMGQPAASERIERLETFLDCRLLLRNARALRCTPEGLDFYERAKTILQDVAQAIAEVSGDKPMLEGTIRIAAPHCFGETIVPEALKQVREAYPYLHLALVLNDRLVDLVTEGVDISFRVGPLGEGTFIACPLGSVERMLVASPGYLLHHGAISGPSELINHPFIRIQSMFGSDRLPLTRVAGVAESARIRTSVTTSHWRPMYEMVVSGMGIGVVEAPACVDALTEGRLVRVLPDFNVPSFDLNMLTQTLRPLPPRVRSVALKLKEILPGMLPSSRNALDGRPNRYIESTTGMGYRLPDSLSLTDCFNEARSEAMPQQLIVAVFDSEDTAEKASRDLKGYEDKGDGFKVQSGVLVQKDAAGKISLLERQTRSLWGTVIGAITGGLVGMLGGPAVAVLGFTVGASGGLAMHTIEDVLDDESIEAISEKLRLGAVALIVEAQEPSPFEVDNIVRGYKGDIFRKLSSAP
ncbi:LysR family transcriptional regulator [Paraburkholderia sp. LEh10]|nr:LysR family transcriptional regulator [Paraburkholderia sp. LEh10]